MTNTKKRIPSLVPQKLPFLEAICWQTKNVKLFTPEEMLTRYERGWQYRHLYNNLEDEELNFVKKLAQYYQSWLQTQLWLLSFPITADILTILKSLNSDILQQGNAYFGGGSLLSLDFGEYRLSKDIDFICSVSLSGYKYLHTKEKVTQRDRSSNLQIDSAQIPKINEIIDY